MTQMFVGPTLGCRPYNGFLFLLLDGWCIWYLRKCIWYLGWYIWYQFDNDDDDNDNDIGLLTIYPHHHITSIIMINFRLLLLCSSWLYHKSHLERWFCPQPCSVFSTRLPLYLEISSLMTKQPEDQGRGRE